MLLHKRPDVFNKYYNNDFILFQINFQTPTIDLSTIYGVDERGLDSVRLYKNGLLKLEYRDFRHVPLANLTSNPVDPITGLAMSTPQLLGNITRLGELLQNFTALGQIKGLGNLVMSEQIPGFGNMIMLNPKTVLNDKNSVNSTLLRRRERQVTVPVSLPSTGGLNDAILSPIVEEVDAATPILIGIVNMTLSDDRICLQNMDNESRCYAFGEFR